MIITSGTTLAEVQEGPTVATVAAADTVVGLVVEELVDCSDHRARSSTVVCGAMQLTHANAHAAAKSPHRESFSCIYMLTMRCGTAGAHGLGGDDPVELAYHKSKYFTTNAGRTVWHQQLVGNQ
eukprot:COSAG02_NODE_301_length_25237_cov_19.918490_16_plen_124_part_00